MVFAQSSIVPVKVTDDQPVRGYEQNTNHVTVSGDIINNGADQQSAELITAIALCTATVRVCWRISNLVAWRQGDGSSSSLHSCVLDIVVISSIIQQI